MDKITAAEYVKLVRRTAKIDGPAPEHYHWLLGLWGEYHELEKEAYPEDGEVDVDKLAAEAGDFLWYAANFTHVFGLNFERVVEHATFQSTWPEKRLYDPFRQVTTALSEMSEVIKRRDWQGKSSFYILEFHIVNILCPLLIILKAADLDVENVMARNIAKLKQRYPNGFDA